MSLELGPDWQRDLWASPYRLRFELSIGGPYVSMFTSAYDRARALARAALPTSEVTAVIAFTPDPRRALFARAKGWAKGSAMEILAEMGVSTETAIAEWEGLWWKDDEVDEYAPLHHRAVRYGWDEADVLLWNQVAQDMGVRPQAPVMSKLVDRERGICVDAYDDRGMDITAITPQPLLGLYRQFDAWLLDYDRPRMAEAFGA